MLFLFLVSDDETYLHRRRKRSDFCVEDHSTCCTFCQDVLKNLLSATCGHRFCRQCWEQAASSGHSSCPQCRKRSRNQSKIFMVTCCLIQLFCVKQRAYLKSGPDLHCCKVVKCFVVLKKAQHCFP